jgi:hypothetical protein
LLFGTHPLVRRFIKGVFENRPSLPWYSATWDIAVVLKYLGKMHPADKLSLKELTLKVVTLLALLSGQRRQTLHALKVSFFGVFLTALLVNIYKYVQIHLKITNRQRRERQ